MKRLTILVAVLASLILGSAFTTIYYENKISNIDEDIISKEIALLSAVPNSDIPCSKLKNAKNWIVEKKGEVTVFWKFTPEQSRATKLVLGKNLSSATESFSTGCHVN
jgi:hypothetical protein